MELIRAFSGEAGALIPDDQVEVPEEGVSRNNKYVLDDKTLLRELSLTTDEAEKEAAILTKDHLEEMNRALDEYILRQMCFKSEIIDEIARLHENCAYAILGVSADATDAEIKKAYRRVAMMCHPDKGGDKEEFQELNNAYEKIMEQRRGTDGKKEDEDDDESPKESKKKEDKDEKEDKDGEEGAEGSNATLVEKAAKAAEEASRYAKTAAEFSHQAAEAAETARKGKEQGSRDTLTKSIAHSAIVLTLTVVKAVRVVGYATLDVAAQCRIAAKRNPNAVGCAERAVTAMSLGLEALNAALACAEVTETTAAELQAPP